MRSFTLAVYIISVSLLVGTAGRILFSKRHAAQSPLRTLTVASAETRFRNKKGQEQPWKRNLFSIPSINPAKDRVAEPASVTHMAKNELPTLLGVIIDSSGKLAVLRTRRRLLRVRKADTVGQWTVMNIEPRAMLLKNGDAVRRLFLDPPAIPK